MNRLTISALIAVFFSTAASAQIYVGGSDPARLKWSQIKTENYKLIYPCGADSLAREYARALEAVRTPVSYTLGYRPGELYKGRTPVILHTLDPQSNGTVTWAPRRLELFTTPSPSQQESISWTSQLAVHESRHLAQMQFGRARTLGVMHLLTGELFTGAASALWPSTHLLEGDATVAETALTPSGRGRSAAFMNIYQSAFLDGDLRTWYAWRYGSYRHYIPNHYALGYMTLAGARYVYDDPLFMQRYLWNASSKLRFFNLQYTMKQASGKNFRSSFEEIENTFRKIWEQEASQRAPFIPSTPFTHQKNDCLYSSAVSDGKNVYALKQTKTLAASLVRIDPQGNEKVLRPFAQIDKLVIAGGRLWWAETIMDARWENEGISKIRYMSLEGGKISTIPYKGNLYMPVVSEDGKTVTALEYCSDGTSSVLSMNLEGRILSEIQVPSGMQLTQLENVQGTLLAACLSDRGNAICKVSQDGIENLTEPSHASMTDFRSHSGELFFTSDRNGSLEIYSFDVSTSKIRQRTSTLNGASDFTFLDQDLVYAVTTSTGKRLFRTSLADLQSKEVSMQEVHKHPVAEKLSSQEREFALNQNGPASSEVEISSPKPYKRLPHLLHFHSWAPVYANADEISSFSGDLDVLSMSPGVTAMFQNNLGTAYGYAGYAYANDEIVPGKKRGSAHLSFTYAGWTPVISAKVDIGQCDRIQYARTTHVNNMLAYTNLNGYLTDTPAVEGEVSVHVPLKWTSAGISKGFVPSATFSFSNHLFSKSTLIADQSSSLRNCGVYEYMKDYVAGDNVAVTNLKLSARAFILRHTAENCDYPKFGLGVEAGYQTRPTLADIYSGAVYAYGYGYLPGLMPSHGIRLTALWQNTNGGDYNRSVVNSRPRGYTSLLNTYLVSASKTQFRLTADYSLPVYLGEIGFMAPLIYVTHFGLKPCIDYTYLPQDRFLKSEKGGFYSAGAEITARYTEFLWFPYSGKIGIEAYYNGGSSYGSAYAKGYAPGRSTIAFVFTMDI